MKIRPSAVSGMFYPKDPDHLEQLMANLFQRCRGRPVIAIGIVAPHAGYVYSGAVAARAYASIDRNFNGTFIIIGPSHRGFETCVSECHGRHLSVSWITISNW